MTHFGIVLGFAFILSCHATCSWKVLIQILSLRGPLTPQRHSKPRNWVAAKQRV